MFVSCLLKFVLAEMCTQYMLGLWQVHAESQCSSKAKAYKIPAVKMCTNSFANASRLIVDTTGAADISENSCNCKLRASSVFVSFTIMPDVFPAHPGYEECGSQILFTTVTGLVRIKCFVAGQYYINSDTDFIFEKIRFPGDSNYCILLDVVGTNKIELDCKEPKATTTSTTSGSTDSQTVTTTPTFTTTMPTTTIQTTSTTFPTITPTTTLQTTSTTFPTITPTTTLQSSSTTTTLQTTSTIFPTITPTTTLQTTSTTTTLQTTSTIFPTITPTTTLQTTSTTTTLPTATTTHSYISTESQGTEITTHSILEPPKMGGPEQEREQNLNPAQVLFPLSQGILLAALALLLVTVCFIRIRRTANDHAKLLSSFNDSHSSSSVRVIIDNKEDGDAEMVEHMPPTMQNDVNESQEAVIETHADMNYSTMEDVNTKSEDDSDEIQGKHINDDQNKNSSSMKMIMNFESDIESESASGDNTTPVYAKVNNQKLSFSQHL